MTLMEALVSRSVELLAISLFVAVIARRIKLPYTVGLIATGILLPFAHVESGVFLTHEFIFDVIIPPLIFEAGLNISWDELKKDGIPVLTLAIFGVIITAAVVAGGLVNGLGWPLSSALVFGVLIAATDPVSVIAMFKDTGVTGRIRLLVESESLLNDGVAAVLFALVLTWTQAHGDATTLAHVSSELLRITGGGIVAGLLCGTVAIAAAWGTSDYLVETALTVVAAYGSFLLAEHFDMSGVLATVTAGLLMGNLGVLREDDKSILSLRGRELVLSSWEFIAFLANSLIFLMIGLTAANIHLTKLGVLSLAFIVAMVLVGRALTVYPLCFFFRWSRWAISLRKQHILWWGGLRGALCLALALSLPESLPLRNEIVIAAFGVVAFSVIVEGITMPFLLKRLGFLSSGE